MPAANRPLLRRWLLFLGLAVLSSACSNPMEDDEGQSLGVIRFYQDPLVIAAPDTVAVGEPFQVSVTTYGGGCTSQGDTRVRVDGRSADITPYDINRPGICIDILNHFEHTASLAFPDPGTIRISFHGMQHPEDILILETREVVVR